MMTRFIQNLKCSLSNRQPLKDYYNGLNQGQLTSKKKDLWKMYVVQTIGWLTAGVLIVTSGDIDMPLLILFLGTWLGTIILLYADYINRRKLIEKTLEKLDH